jgi:hypothetical protein
MTQYAFHRNSAIYRYGAVSIGDSSCQRYDFGDILRSYLQYLPLSARYISKQRTEKSIIVMKIMIHFIGRNSALFLFFDLVFGDEMYNRRTLKGSVFYPIVEPLNNDFGQEKKCRRGCSNHFSLYKTIFPGILLLDERQNLFEL